MQSLNLAIKSVLPLGIFRGVFLAGLLFLPFRMMGQRATDAQHPEGKWDTLDRCQLLPQGVVDGDSFVVKCKDRDYSFRLYYVDAPEADTEFEDRVEDQAAYFGIATKDIPRAGELAAKFTREKLSGRSFTVRTRWQNALGRGNLARYYGVVLVEGKDLGEELVANGLVRVHGLKAILPDGTRATQVISKLKNLELTAREQRRGIWNEARFPRTPTRAPRTSAAPATVMADSPLDLNNASYEALQKLPGIGPKLAQRIVAHRPYKTVSDLDRVPGIGKQTLEELAPFVRARPPQP